MDKAMDPLKRITERVSRAGDLDSPDTPMPLLTLEEFFDGNDAKGSICCNLDPIPEPAKVRNALESIAAREPVTDVRVQVTMFEDPSWPFSDTIWLITSAPLDDIWGWFPPELQPDDIQEGWLEGINFEPVLVPKGHRPVGCWWD